MDLKKRDLSINPVLFSDHGSLRYHLKKLGNSSTHFSIILSMNQKIIGIKTYMMFNTIQVAMYPIRQFSVLMNELYSDFSSGPTNTPTHWNAFFIPNWGLLTSSYAFSRRSCRRRGSFSLSFTLPVIYLMYVCMNHMPMSSIRSL